MLCHFLFLGFEGKLKSIFVTVIFCLIPVSGHTSKTKHTIFYPNLSLALKLVPCNEGLSVLKRLVF